VTQAALSPDHLVAWTVEVDDPGDLLSWLPDGHAFAFLRGRDGIVGWGEAARVVTTSPARTGDELAADVADLLGRITTRDDVGVAGTGAVAMTSLVFDPDATGSVVVVPKVALGRRDGRSWLTLVMPPGAVRVPALRRRPTAAPAPVAARVVGEVPPAQTWRDIVAGLVARLQADEADKVVLARAVDIEADRTIDARAVAARLVERFPSCFTYICAGLVGASPELLVRRTGRQAESLVLAGSVRRGHDAEEDGELEHSLLASPKNRHEHAVAVDSVRDVLSATAVDIDVEPEPQLVRLANITHLGTHVQAWLPTPSPTALELAAALHPTAAVGGAPADVAVEMIRELEAAPRGRYAAPVGWVDARGDGEFAIALRCAQLDGPRARVWAGAGVVRESEPDAELAETDVKLDAVMRALLS
jgi:menaquinone-specific isochorismate synthase